jgi:hypothetical protein
MKVYLCGPINGRSDDDCKGWREYAKERLPDTLDPMARDYRGRELEPGIADVIVAGDEEDIAQVTCCSSITTSRASGRRWKSAWP